MKNTYGIWDFWSMTVFVFLVDHHNDRERHTYFWNSKQWDVLFFKITALCFDFQKEALS